MLAELHVRDLGVIANLHLSPQAGMTAVTGETGAGKTLLVEAIDLLVGGRPDGVLVRAGAEEAWVEGRFVSGDDEIVLARAVPRSGRSRAYVDGRMAPVSALGEVGGRLVDLHGQHAHQSLLSTAVQRAALDAFAAVDHAPLAAGRRRLAEVDADLAALGGDEDARAREADLLRFQMEEVEGARLSDPDEEAALEAEEDRLGDATAHREAAALAYRALSADGGVDDGVRSAIAAVAGRGPLAHLESRLRALAAEAADAASELRAVAEQLEDDPERLAEVRARRRLLRELRRKYGASLGDVIEFAARARGRLEELGHSEELAVRLRRDRAEAVAAVRAAEAVMGASRRRAAPELAAAVEEHLRDLALPDARFEVRVGDEDPADDVAFLLGANVGEPALPLARVASGGELARTMLALRLVLVAGPAPGTLVFDEVDAGIGGEAALAVGRSLAALARGVREAAPASQVLVVTHLPQVAAFADHHVVVRKVERGGRAVAEACAVDGEARVAELSRMLSGHPDSRAARRHAEELLHRAGGVVAPADEKAG